MEHETGRKHRGAPGGSSTETADSFATGVHVADATSRQAGALSDYVSEMAQRMDTFSSTLRTRSGDELLHDLSRIARENPGLFVTGSVAIGFGLARIARASRQQADASPIPAPRPGVGSSEHWPQSGSRDYAVDGIGTGTSMASADTASVDPASAGPQGGFH